MKTYKFSNFINKNTMLKCFSMVFLFYCSLTEGLAQVQKSGVQKEDSLTSRAPHGGRLEYSGGYYLELVNNKKKLAFYIYDADIKPASNKQVTGYLIVKAVNKNISKYVLKEVGENGFTPGNGIFNTFASCKITLKTGEKTLIYSFKDMRMNVVQYTCPVHPEIVKNEPGQCPKCGMELVEKKDIAKGPLDLKSE
jgi:hypothetical protein